MFDICYKPTNSFYYLTYSSCHPSHTKNNVGLSLAKQINIVADNRRKGLNELQKHLIKKAPIYKCFQAKFNKSKDLEKKIIRTFNPNSVINLKKTYP